MQQSLPRNQRSGQHGALHCFKPTLTAHTEAWELKENLAPDPRPSAEALRAARLRAVKTAPFVCAAESAAAAQPFAKSACLNFYFCFLPTCL